jgi:serine/threonine-protein kinase
MWLLPVAAVLIGIAALVLVSRLLDDPPAPPVRVPDFVGMGRAEAQRAADRLGIEVTFREMESDAPKGKVFDQVPAARALYAPGSTAVLLLSTGPGTIAVPSVAGARTAEEIEAIIEGAGLTFAGFIEVRNETGILGTDPAEGTQVPPGTLVSVYFGTDEPRGNGGGGGNGDGQGNDKREDDD